MQPFYELIQQGLGAIPIIDHFIKKLALEDMLTKHLRHKRYAQAILLLVKNVIIKKHALYGIKEWASWYDSSLVYGGSFSDDTIARGLDRLFSIDRSSLLTQLVVSSAKKFNLNLDQVHQDSTSVKFSGNYHHQNKKATQLKRGHSKDHRPDLKQLVYSLSVTQDGAIPIHFKAYDGNRTDDTLHLETWQTLRGLLSKSDFLYVADSKLCVSKTLIDLDRNQGKFITVLPKTRNETKIFNDKLIASEIRWEIIYKKQSSRKSNQTDVYEVAGGLHQMNEGFKIYWFRSSQKKTRDYDAREENILTALSHLESLNDPKNKKRPKTQKIMEKRIEEILTKFKAKSWIKTKIIIENKEFFKQIKRGRATENTSYRKIVQQVPSLIYIRDLDGIARSEVMDGVFPLVTNTSLSAKEALKNYKYQPTLEKRHSLLKSVLEVSPVFLKKNERVESLMFVYFIAQLLSALIERELRLAMSKQGKESISILPEERASKQPTTEQIVRIFQHQARRLLYVDKERVQTFSEPLTKVQQEILDFLKITDSVYY